MIPLLVKKIIKIKLLSTISHINKLKTAKKKFVIVSNNCWGAELYKELGRPYNTPFVGLFIYCEDYLKLLENFELYLKYDLKFTDVSKWTNKITSYPLAKLNDIEIHFMHYKDKNEVVKKWNRRLKRMLENNDYSNFYFKICDRDLPTKDLFNRFHELPFKNKISFSLKKINYQNHITIIEEDANNLPDGVELFKVMNKKFDIFNWLKSGKVGPSYLSKLKYNLLK